MIFVKPFGLPEKYQEFFTQNKNWIVFTKSDKDFFISLGFSDFSKDALNHSDPA